MQFHPQAEFLKIGYVVNLYQIAKLNEVFYFSLFLGKFHGKIVLILQYLK